MDFLGIGPLEILLVVLVALLVLGPKDMAKTGRMLGRLMRKTLFSPAMLMLRKRISDLPYEMMREAGIEEEMQTLKEVQRDIQQTSQMGMNAARQSYRDVNKPEMIPPDWLPQPPQPGGPAAGGPEENQILPPNSAWTQPARQEEKRHD